MLFPSQAPVNSIYELGFINLINVINGINKYIASHGVYSSSMKTPRQTYEQQIALTWDTAYSQGFRCGEERGFALGFDAGLEEAATEER
jgi:hypothetical protein